MLNVYRSDKAVIEFEIAVRFHAFNAYGTLNRMAATDFRAASRCGIASKSATIVVANDASLSPAEVNATW